jgi:hypothetical protein
MRLDENTEINIILLIILAPVNKAKSISKAA